MPANIDFMDLTPIRAAFADRMHTLCDALGVARGHGRNATLGRMFDVTPNAARKWLKGEAYPEMPLAVAMCDKARINVLWLLQGTPPMRGERVDPQALALAEAMQALPLENRNAALDYLRFQFERSGNWFTAEALRRYLVDLDAMKAQTPTHGEHSKPTGTHG